MRFHRLVAGRPRTRCSVDDGIDRGTGCGHEQKGENMGSTFMRARAFARDEQGSATAEYAVATMAAVGFAGLLVVLLRGDEVRAILTDLVTRALSSAG
jgi:Flp pilus assembly pilin Flp